MNSKKTEALIEAEFSVDASQNLKVLDSHSLKLSQYVEGETIEYPVSVFSTKATDERFAGALDMDNFWQHVRQEIGKMFAPFKKGTNLLLVLGLGIALNFLQWALFVNTPIARGWRLDIVRRMGEGSARIVPNLMPLSIWRYFRKGLVLIVMRGLYFLPHALFLFLSSNQFFLKLKDIVLWGFEKWRGKEEEAIVDYILRTIPEFAFDLMLQFVVVLLYLVLVWPVYRITMIKYAMGQIRGSGFLSPVVLMDSIRIYTKESALILGIYFFTLLTDFLVALIIFILVSISLGFIGFILPMLVLLIQHWPKGYAYGVLAHQLIQKGYIISPKQSKSEDNQLI